MNRHGAVAARRGAALIVSLWVVIALTGLVLSLSYTMRVEAIAGANRMSQAQADAAERGMEQLLLWLVDLEMSSPGSMEEVSLEARQIGECLAWVIRPDASNDDTLAYGMTDEAGKVDLNTADAEMLLRLPGVTQEVADSIIDWRDADANPGSLGGEDDYYLSLPWPYRCKNGPLESVEELLLVKGVTREVLYGYDRNHNGILDGRETQTSNTGALLGGAVGSGRGLYPFVTVYGVRASGSGGNGVSQPLADVNARDTSRLRTAMQQSLSSSRADEIAGRLRILQPFSSVFDFYYRTGLTESEFSNIYMQIQCLPASAATSQPTAEPAVAKLNINSASLGAMLALPGLDETDASAILSHRATGSDVPANIAWLVSALPREKVLAIGNMVTGSSRVYSGEIVALSPDGRAFRRCRVVISAETTPSRIVYRKDITAAGWPLDAGIRQQIREGKTYRAPVEMSSEGGSAL